MTPPAEREKVQGMKRFAVNKRLLYGTLSGLGIFFFLYSPTVQWLIATWSHDKPYSHGFFVPFIFCYLIWIKREQLAHIPPRPAWFSGGLILGVCCLLLLLGRIGAIIQLEVISLYFFVPGVILFIWGWRTLQALWFPVFFLQFMIPWIDPFLKYVYPVFRHIAATLGAWFLHLHYPVMQDGTFIYLPDITLSVIDACSGINFFISVTAVGLLLAYLTQKSWKRVFVVLVAGIVVTVLANGIRVALAGVMGQEYGASMLHGPGHIFRGWFVAQLGWILIFFVNWLVGRLPHPQTLHLYERWKGKVQQREKEGAAAGKTTHVASSAVVLLSILFCFAIYLNFFSQPAAVTLAGGFSGIPEKIGQWQGRDVAWLPDNVYFPGADPTLLRRYQTGSGKEVYVYIGYFAVQQDNARLVSYHSRSLFAGKKIITFTTDEGRTMRTRVTHAMIGPVRYRILSWYQYPGSALVNKYKVKIQGIRDALLHHRNNGAVILLAIPILNGESDKDRVDDLVAFAQHIAPLVHGIISAAGP